MNSKLTNSRRRSHRSQNTLCYSLNSARHRFSDHPKGGWPTLSLAIILTTHYLNLGCPILLAAFWREGGPGAVTAERSAPQT